MQKRGEGEESTEQTASLRRKRGAGMKGERRCRGGGRAATAAVVEEQQD